MIEKNTEQRLWLIQGNSKQTLTPIKKKKKLLIYIGVKNQDKTLLAIRAYNNISYDWGKKGLKYSKIFDY